MRRGTALLGALIGCALAPAPAAADGGWGLVESPAPRAHLDAILYGTACGSPTDCWAVGWSSNGGSTVSVVRHWNGRSWDAVPTPAPKTSSQVVSYGLNAVTCLSPDECWAVGSSYDGGSTSRPLMQRWDGRSWSLVPGDPTGGVDTPLGVTCASSSDCWAVGYTFVMTDCPESGCGTYSLIHHWDGQAWSRVRSPSPFLGGSLEVPFNVLSSVTCASATDCWAAGYGHDGTRHHPILARWDGRRWADVPAGSIPSADSSAFLGVACASPSLCWAVGQTKPVSAGAIRPRPLVHRWDGTTWSAVVPGGVNEGQLAGVACAAASECVAVGYEADAAGTHKTLVERWDGASWERVDAPSPTTKPGVRLHGVTCPAAGECVAAGTYTSDLDVTQPMALHLDDGRWDTTLSELVGEAGAAFQGVACTTGADCWAVGFEIAGHRAIVSRWNGAGWEIVPSPRDPAASSEGLFGVACASSADCRAVGWAWREGGFKPLVEHWDGAEWRRGEAPALSPAAESGHLQDVACASATACWAVGQTIDADLVAHPFVARWDGRSWTSDPAHPSRRLEGYLAGVACTTATDCWAVGAQRTAASQRPLVEHWDGSSWVPVGSPELALNETAGLLSVTCPSRSDCWAVGGRAGADGVFSTLAQRWDGSAWRAVTSPSRPSGHSELVGVACSTAARCWALGANLHDDGRQRAFLEAWDGRSWTTVEAPDTGAATTRASLAGIACVAGTPECRAVGYWADPFQVHTLAAHHPVTPAATSSPDAGAAPEAGAPEAAPPGRALARIRLRVVPTRVRARRRIRFRFQARVAGRPVRGARVTFARRRARTNRRGRAVIVASVRPGRHRARAAKRGLRTGVALVRARRARPGSTGRRGAGSRGGRPTSDRRSAASRAARR
jgi:hypothetical protein